MSTTRDILLVDDDSTMLYLLGAFLEYKGFAVTTASGGIKALEALEHNKFRMMITDFNMPEMNGVELATWVRKRHADLPVVMVTASSMTHVVEAAAEAGISHIVSKPLDLKRLVAVVSSVLQAGRNPSA